MLREHGFRVTGSDSGVYPPASTLLESLGISFFHSFDAANLQPAPDLVIVGNIIARGNPELEEVLDRKIAYRSMPETLEEVFSSPTALDRRQRNTWKNNYDGHAGMDFSHRGEASEFLVGGVAENFGKSTGLAAGKSSFLKATSMKRPFGTADPIFHYHPDDLIVTSLEYDHADIYPDFETYHWLFAGWSIWFPARARDHLGRRGRLWPGSTTRGRRSVLPCGNLRVQGRE